MPNKSNNPAARRERSPVRTRSTSPERERDRSLSPSSYRPTSPLLDPLSVRLREPHTCKCGIVNIEGHPCREEGTIVTPDVYAAWEKRERELQAEEQQSADYKHVVRMAASNKLALCGDSDGAIRRARAWRAGKIWREREQARGAETIVDRVSVRLGIPTFCGCGMPNIDGHPCSSKGDVVTDDILVAWEAKERALQEEERKSEEYKFRVDQAHAALTQHGIVDAYDIMRQGARDRLAGIRFQPRLGLRIERVALV